MFELPTDFVKVIHIELSNEGGEVFVSKVDGEDILLKLFDVLDVEAESVVAPGDEIRVFLFLHGNWNTSKISYVLDMNDGTHDFSLALLWLCSYLPSIYG